MKWIKHVIDFFYADEFLEEGDRRQIALRKQTEYYIIL